MNYRIKKQRINYTKQTFWLVRQVSVGPEIETNKQTNLKNYSYRVEIFNSSSSSSNSLI